MNIKIYPLDKLEIDGASVCFGMHRNEVEATIGKGEFVGQRYYYYNSEMAIDYDPENCVKFVEFLSGVDGALKPFIYGVSAFETDADELVSVLKEKNGGQIEDNEQGYSYGFNNISVGIYRELRPVDVEEMIEEMKADGITVDNNGDLEADRRRANHWATIGAGIEGYYR